MALSTFHPAVSTWFRERFGEPTEAQRCGWPHIVAGHNTLIAAPTGSGKTLAAFLTAIDRLLQQAVAGSLADETQVLYVSPFNALSNDIQRNLQTPLKEIGQNISSNGSGLPPIRVLVYTGDPPPAQRQAMLRRPPHILVTTPESLYLLLTAAKSRQMLQFVKMVIVDEIHALVRDKRGSHLALSMERLEALCDTTPLRIGLSATQRPVDEMACFLVGARHVDSLGKPNCAIVDLGHPRSFDLAVEAALADRIVTMLGGVIQANLRASQTWLAKPSLVSTSASYAQVLLSR